MKEKPANTKGIFKLKKFEPKGNFTQIPNALITSNLLSTTEFRITAYLLSNADEFPITQTYCVKALNIKPDTFKATISKLIKIGFISTVGESIYVWNPERFNVVNTTQKDTVLLDTVLLDTVQIDTVNSTQIDTVNPILLGSDQYQKGHCNSTQIDTVTVPKRTYNNTNTIQEQKDEQKEKTNTNLQHCENLEISENSFSPDLKLKFHDYLKDYINSESIRETCIKSFYNFNQIQRVSYDNFFNALLNGLFYALNELEENITPITCNKDFNERLESIQEDYEYFDMSIEDYTLYFEEEDKNELKTNLNLIITK